MKKINLVRFVLLVVIVLSFINNKGVQKEDSIKEEHWTHYNLLSDGSCSYIDELTLQELIKTEMIKDHFTDNSNYWLGIGFFSE